MRCQLAAPLTVRAFKGAWGVGTPLLPQRRDFNLDKFAAQVYQAFKDFPSYEKLDAIYLIKLNVVKHILKTEGHNDYNLHEHLSTDYCDLGLHTHSNITQYKSTFIAQCALQH